MPAKNKSKQAHNQFLKDRLGKINEIISKFESEVEKALGELRKRSEKSSKLLKKNFDEVFDKISSTKIYSQATEKTEELSKEVKRVADEVLAKIKKVDLGAARELINEVRGNMDELVQKFQSYGLLEKAVDAAQNTRRQVFKLFSIPSKDEVDALSRKVNSLERKIKTLAHKKEKEVVAA